MAQYLRLALALAATSTFISGAAALPASSEDTLVTRGATFNDFGDHTGSTSRYNTDSTGTYVKSGDVYTYSSGVKCWTDLVNGYFSLLDRSPLLTNQLQVLRIRRASRSAMD